MVVMNEVGDHLDTLEFCQTLNISRQEFDSRMATIKDRNRNPGYSRFTQQLFLTQLSDKDFSVFQEKMYRFPGFYVQRRSIRQYQYPYAAHVLGDVAEVSPAEVEADDYYQPGDYIGKLGVERSYERQLRGEKGVKIPAPRCPRPHSGQLPERCPRPPPQARQEPHAGHRLRPAGSRRAAHAEQDRLHRGH